MVWKCPPLHLPNWNHLWKWKQEMNLSKQLRETVGTIRVKPYAIADLIPLLVEAADLLDKYEQVLQSIANEHIELSHDKIKWQCEDHVRWAKEVLK